MKSTTRDYYQQVVTAAVNSIRSGLDEAIELPELAARAALAPLHFHRIFRGLLGETPLEMHRRLRLERAASALATTATSVTRVAFEAGYESHESFTRAFAGAFGMPPSEFRAAAQAQPLPWTASVKATLAATSRIHANSKPNAKPAFSTEELKMEVTITQCPTKHVLAVQHHGPYTAVSEAFARLDAIARPAGLLERADVEMVAIFHDDPDVTPASELRADAGLAVPANVDPIRGLHRLTIPAGTYARVVHVGPYEALADSWSQLMGHWLPKSGNRIGQGPSYERYLNTPLDVPASELRTELYLPISALGPATE